MKVKNTNPKEFNLRRLPHYIMLGYYTSVSGGPWAFKKMMRKTGTQYEGISLDVDTTFGIDGSISINQKYDTGTHKMILTVTLLP